MTRQSGILFDAPAGVEPAESGRVVQGFLEGSNVNSVLQIARMIEVQRAYEMGQSFAEAEDERIRTAIKALTK
jgi:flagellar basal-body rod protein FlgF